MTEAPTTDPGNDYGPVFSPDGRSIGFVRVSNERTVFIVIPAIGGPERIVAELNRPEGSSLSYDWRPFAWSALGQGVPRGFLSNPSNPYTHCRGRPTCWKPAAVWN